MVPHAGTTQGGSKIFVPCNAYMEPEKVSRESLKISDEQTLAGVENGLDKQLQGLRMDLTNNCRGKEYMDLTNNCRG